MINWDKPIETIDGRKARVIGLHPEPRGNPDDEGYFVPRMVWVESKSNHLFGDVFLVSDGGVRCDDTAWRARPSLPEMRDPIIRNVPIKREGWVVARAGIEAPVIERTTLHPTQKAAQAACVLQKHFPMFVSWEEYQ